MQGPAPRGCAPVWYEFAPLELAKANHERHSAAKAGLNRRSRRGQPNTSHGAVGGVIYWLT
jgi:hypothetical protein